MNDNVYTEDCNISGLTELLNFQVYKSKKTGKYYTSFIHHTGGGFSELIKAYENNTSFETGDFNLSGHVWHDCNLTKDDYNALVTIINKLKPVQYR